MSAYAEIKKLIEKEAAKGQIIELDLSSIKINNFTDEIKNLLSKYKNVEVLIISNCGLTSIENLPDWSLTAIDVSDNKLQDGQVAILVKKFKQLAQIIFAANQIKHLQSLNSLSELKNLEEVDFSENPIAKLPNYRSYLFEKSESLAIIDRVDREGNEIQEEEILGSDEDEDEDDDDDFQEQGSDDDYDEESESDEKPKKKQK